MITLITGGAHSGKSGYAETLAEQSGLQVVYLATAQAGDVEMEERIRRHRARRPTAWLTVEEPLAIGAALRAHARADRCIVIDCFSLWLTNLMLAQHSASGTGGDVGPIDPGPRFAAERADLLDALRTLSGQMIAISNEVGMSVVPLGALNRFFIDETGHLNQAIAAFADKVVWMVAGCPVVAKGGA